MDLQKINVKFFVENSEGIPPTVFIDIFQTWIQGSDGDYYDVADYSHMHAGPGILLIFHEANISMDETGDRRGLLYNQKQPLSGSNEWKLQVVFKSALEFCKRIEDEPVLRGRLKFRGNEVLFLINDRLLAPSSDETFYSLRPDLEGLAHTLYGGADYTLRYDPKPKERFSVLISTPHSFDVRTLLKNLEIGSRAVVERCQN